MKKTLIILVLILCSFITIKPCPMTITNDGKKKIFVTDPNSGKAVYIMPGKSQIIDPTIYGLQRFVFNEKLNFYVEDNSNKFFLRYQLIEKFCTDKKTVLSLTDIKNFVKKPTKRFRTKMYEKQKEIAHTH